MIFREGLFYAYKNRRTDGEVTDPFYLYCRLSDLCTSSYADKRKVELFYAIDKRLCIFETLIKQGENGQNELLNSYLVVSELLSEDSFKKLIECAVWAMSPTAELPIAEVKKEEKPIIKKPQKITPVVVERAEEEEEKETRTPLNGYGDIDEDISLFLGCGAILLLASLLVGFFGLLVGIFHWNIPWVVWQLLIGVVGGGWLTLGVGLLVYLLHDGMTCDYFISGFICLCVVTVVNFILLLCLRGDYKAIFVCFSLWEILGGLLLTSICFYDIQDEWGWVHLATSFLLLLITVISLICL